MLKLTRQTIESNFHDFYHFMQQHCLMLYLSISYATLSPGPQSTESFDDSLHFTEYRKKQNGLNKLQQQKMPIDFIV